MYNLYGKEEYIMGIKLSVSILFILTETLYIIVKLVWSWWEWSQTQKFLYGLWKTLQIACNIVYGPYQLYFFDSNEVKSYHKDTLLSQNNSNWTSSTCTTLTESLLVDHHLDLLYMDPNKNFWNLTWPYFWI